MIEIYFCFPSPVPITIHRVSGSFMQVFNGIDTIDI